MLAGKAEAAAVVVKSFKNSRRSVLMLNFTSLDYLGGNRVRQLNRRSLRLRDD
jgi:hypothetical protein